MTQSLKKRKDDRFFYEVACRVDEIVLAELVGEMPPEEKLMEMYSFSEEFEQKMRSLVSTIGQKRKIPKSVKRIIIIAAAILALAIGALNAGAILKSLHDLYLICFEDFSFATYQDISDSDLSDGSDHVVDESVAVNITRFYIPTYIPDGYVEEKEIELGVCRYIHYSNGHDTIIFSQSALSVSMQLDTEDAQVVYITDGGLEGCYIEKNGEITLIFEKHGYVFRVEGKLSASEAIKIAKSVMPEQ